MLGVRGIPNVEGGVETHVEQLYPRLVSLGCEVEVLVRTPFVPRQQTCFGSIRLRRLWSPRTPGLEALVHSVIGVLYAGFARPNILHIHAIGPAIVTPIARLLGLKVVVTNHGPDYDRDKWGPFARRVLRVGERLGMKYSNARIVISQVIGDLVRANYGRVSELIPNGVTIHEPSTDTGHLARFGLLPGRFFLHVGRMVPEKRQLDLIEAYRSVLPNGWRLAIAGRLTEDAYSVSVREAARAKGVVLTGFVKGAALEQLYSHAGAFVLPSSHEGLPIAMLEALSYGLPVLASDIPANLAVGLEPKEYFPLGDVPALAQALMRLSQQPPDPDARASRRRWVAERYDWNRIAERTYALYETTSQVRK